MTSEEEPHLFFVSWNTRGIKTPPQKFTDLKNNLSELQADIVFIQETHIGTTCYSILENVEKWKVYFTVYNSNSKGVAILIRDTVKFEYICHDEDWSGSYIVLFCRLYGELYTLVNVYNHKADKILLDRLKDYLLETAEGVLVVGGDFNIVLDSSFDRKTLSFKHSKLKTDILNNFTVSLNLRDTWSYFYPIGKVYTWKQNNISSRLDMFFMHNDVMGRVCDIRVPQKKISDHNPVVLELRVHRQAGNKIPKVALFLDEFGYNEPPDRNVCKISGAEVLSAIKALNDWEEERPDNLQVSYYKRFQHSMSEILKINYNFMIKSKYVVDLFKNQLDDGHIFNVDYLIFSDILAKRLIEAITFTSNRKINCKELLTVTIKKRPMVKSSFLRSKLEELKEHHITLKPISDILDSLLPKFTRFSHEYTRLEKHQHHVRKVLQSLLENNLFIKAEKCKFHTTSTTFPGFVIAFSRLEMEPAKVQAISHWPTPASRRDLQRFLGFGNFYWRFIRGYSSVDFPEDAILLQRGGRLSQSSKEGSPQSQFSPYPTHLASSW
ncbi:uncharacterized protein LOC128520023 [Clarias gariepinus]|uniref:uncharacterized protein LOC128520023 n=1 Tax=Clarias gariepinus TaxID=13013 RepID=UPI00234C9BF0|nr:uncharacterized protein LOC128520023 [Clarias gariepinus]